MLTMVFLKQYPEVFDLIRPYSDSEIPEALNRLVQQPQFISVVNYLFQGTDPELIRQKILKCTSVKDYQMNIMFDSIRAVLNRTIEELTYDGLENLDREKAYIYVSNHRDIVLDPAIILFILVKNEFDTGEIALGDNLLLSPFIVDVAKTNKVLTVFRSGTLKQRLQNSRYLSSYIRHTILDKNTSIWIAQRNGRTKDGLDQTDPGLLKMFYMSNLGQPPHISLSELNIVPVSISYEIEPCDDLKAMELIKSRSGNYSKEEDEDYISILTGLKQKKGRVHVGFGKPIEKSIMSDMYGSHNNDFYKNLAEHLDSKIAGGYKLWPVNFLAQDLLFNRNRNSERYTPDDKTRFENYMKTKIADKDEEFEKQFLKIYSNPILAGEKNISDN